MKTILRILPVLLLIAGLSGCSAQKPAAGTDRRGAGPDALSGSGPEALYGQALKALDGRRFVVEAAEFYLPKGGAPVKSPSGSYISMQGNKGIICFSRNVFPRETWKRLNIEDDTAEITEMEPKKNGDRQFFIKIVGPQKGEEREIILTLYRNTNKCFARVNYYRSSHLFDFIGYVYPAGE